MKKNKPMISVLVPVYNENPNNLRISLRSIISQTFINFECIVVDDSTNQDTIDVCETICNSDSRFLYIKPPYRLGLAASLNLALKRASGDFLARFDSDDICMPDRLLVQFNFLNDHPDVDILGCAIGIIDLDGRLVAKKSYPVMHKTIERKFIFTNSIAHPAVMARRSVFLNAGGYDETYKYSEDLDLWLRLLSKGFKFHNLTDQLILYRQSSSSRSKDNWRCNIRARYRNLSSKFLIFKVIAIIGIFLWSLFPKVLQKLIYKSLMIRAV
jgi:glycosyltransferase involved in cell wall biosynthesis